MRFNPHLLDEIRARLPVSQVVGRKVALKKAGREYKGLSPFKVEKTPSFTVNDQKGFYHCFATGEHGDIFTFLMKTEGLDFPEAVERLAAEAGVPMPKREEHNPEVEDRRERLYRLLEASARFFEASFKGSVGREARSYVERRGLQHETITAFRIGYAPNSRTALGEHLLSQGFTRSEMALAGMQIAGDDIPDPYDRFRHRVMFPITDLKGRVIAFGGRALDKDAPAKYLNSPETPLFHKGALLFNAARARPVAHDKDRVIVVEGYMDVVALFEGGFAEAVAPLGTALTEDQAKLLWRMAAEPILCFDGDAAGRKAANRAIDTILPHLKPGYSANFAFLPDGLDPDDLVRQQGADAMSVVFDKSRPLIDVLWDRETSAGPLATPEQRAALETRLNGLVAGIADQTVRGHYLRELRDRLYRLGRTAAPRTGGRPATAPRSGQASYASPVAPAGDWRNRERERLDGRPARRWQRQTGIATPATPSRELTAALTPPLPTREALIMKTLLNHPWLIDEHSEQVADLALTSQPLCALRDEILAIHARSNSLDMASLRSQLTKTGVVKVVDLVARTITHASDRFAEPDASATDVEAAWGHLLSLHQHLLTLERELKAAVEQWVRDCTPEAETRLLEIKRQIELLMAVDPMVNEIEGPENGQSNMKRAG